MSTVVLYEIAITVPLRSIGLLHWPAAFINTEQLALHPRLCRIPNLKYNEAGWQFIIEAIQHPT